MSGTQIILHRYRICYHARYLVNLEYSCLDLSTRAMFLVRR